MTEDYHERNIKLFKSLVTDIQNLSKKKSMNDEEYNYLIELEEEFHNFTKELYLVQSEIRNIEPKTELTYAHCYASRLHDLMRCFPISILTQFEISVYLRPTWFDCLRGYCNNSPLFRFDLVKVKDLPLDILILFGWGFQFRRRHIWFINHVDNLLEKYSGISSLMVVKPIDCIHTALQTISFEDWRGITDINDFVKDAHNKNREISNEKAKVDLCWEDDWFSLCSWAQGIAEAGVEALYLEGELEENLHSNSTSLVKTLREIYLPYMSMEQIIKHIQHVAKQCKFEGCYHLPSLISNLDPIVNYVRECYKKQVTIWAIKTGKVNYLDQEKVISYYKYKNEPLKSTYTPKEIHAFNDELEDIFSFVTKLDFKYQDPKDMMNAIMKVLNMEQSPAFEYWKKIRELLGKRGTDMENDINWECREGFLKNWKFEREYMMSPHDGAVQGITGELWIDDIDSVLKAGKEEVIKKAKEIRQKNPNTKIIKSRGFGG